MPTVDVQHPVAVVQAALNPFAAIARSDDPCWLGGSGPLAGVLTSVKYILDVAGLPTRRGSRSCRDAPPAMADCGAVARLRAAGAAIIAKSTTTEFAHSPLGYAPLEGLTRNPWNGERSCGGSSSGAGGAVATGATPLALATDAGCSTRLPAALNGLFGLKPTLGRIAHERLPDCFANIVHLGIITANVDLMVRAFAVLAGPHPYDAQNISLAPGLAPDMAPLSVEGRQDGFARRRIKLWMRVGNEHVHPLIDAAMHRVSARLQSIGAIVEEADCPLPNPNPTWQTLQQSSWADRFADLPPESRAALSDSFNAGIDAGAQYNEVDLTRALARRTAYFRAIQQIFSAGYDFILTPCASAPAVAADHSVDAPLIIGGQAVGSLREAWVPYLSLFDLSGHPALSLPAEMDDSGMPIGFQLVAPWGTEQSLLDAAAEWERAHPFPNLAGQWRNLTDSVEEVGDCRFLTLGRRYRSGEGRLAVIG